VSSGIKFVIRHLIIAGSCSIAHIFGTKESPFRKKAPSFYRNLTATRKETLDIMKTMTIVDIFDHQIWDYWDM
jgi:hypothetical protein